MIVDPKAKGGKAYTVTLNGVDVTSRCSTPTTNAVRSGVMRSTPKGRCTALQAGRER
jgi:hypothetical protein